ncbi:MAG: Acyl-CoA thioesterase FadM [Thermodesulfobacterium sp.]|uniref:Acyl-CoA thioesterase FadM n=1 Tax=Candidatus Thermodesulfobacterium syntrophicum TaxID=3060442 RepID=A0AAE3P312_9BACT|nr:Acyl-CoA thioesterase FadM [Candidatus Thermodesulfobacterium syntrophicum]
MIKVVNYRVIYGDTDCGNVMYYGNYLRLFEIGRTELIRSTGLSYKEIEEKGIILPVVEVFAKYRASAKYDDLLTIKTSLKELKMRKIVFEYKIFKNTTLLTEGYTVHVPINREGKIVKFPEDIYKILKNLLKK